MDLDTLEVFAADVLRRARAHLPAVILAYNATPAPVGTLGSGRARATIGLVPQGADGIKGKPVPIVNCPVVWPRFGGYSLVGPLVPGDTVLACIADRSLDTWLLAGGNVPIDSDRMHEITDAVLIPGLVPATKPLPALAGLGLYMGQDAGASYLSLLASVARLVGAPVQLGSATAAEAVIRGTSLAAALATISGVLTAVPAASDPVSVIVLANANKAAILAIIAAVAANLSPTVLVP